MVKKLLEKIKNTPQDEYWSIKWDIIDNWDKLSNKEQEEIISLFMIRFGKNETWHMLITLFNYGKKCK